MAAIQVPFGYGSKKVGIDRLDDFATWNKLHPEFKRRVQALLEASGGNVGCGTGWRSSEVQRQVFLQRHTVSPRGKIQWEGKRWALKSGMAPAAPPGRSFHEGVNNQLAMAIDIVGDVAWADAHAAEFGLQHFANVNREPWHLQCAELPRSVTAWIKAGRPQPHRQAGVPAKPAVTKPAEAVYTPTGAQHPTLHFGDHGSAVATMQGFLVAAGCLPDEPGSHDGRLGVRTQAALRAFQADHHLDTDGICGPKTWQALAAAPPPARSRPIVRRGETGAAVTEMQSLLVAAGCLPDTPASRDGRFGPRTQQAVKQFQADYGLDADGICGPQTWRALAG